MKASEALGILNLSSDATPEQIKKAYFRLVRANPPEKDPEQFQRIREAYEMLRDHQDDLSLDNSLEYPSDPGVYMLVRSAEEFRAAEKYAKAAALLEQAVRLAPDEPVPLFEIVQTYLSSGNTQKAAGKAERLVQICPENQNAWKLYASALFNRGWYKKALPAFRRVAELGGTEDINFRIAYMQAAFMSGNRDEGYRLARKILEKERWQAEEIDYPIETLNRIAIHQNLKKAELRDFLNLYLAFLRHNHRVLDDIPDLMSPLYGLLRRQIEEQKCSADSCQMILTAADEVARLFPNAAEEVRHYQYVVLNQTLFNDRKLTLEAWPLLASALANDDNADTGMIRYRLADAKLCIVMEPETARKELPHIRKSYPMLYAEFADFFDELLSGNTENLQRRMRWEYDKFRGRYSGGLFEGKYEPKKREPEKSTDLFDSLFAPQAPVIRDNPKVGRNDPCPCGSGKKFKQCCIGKGIYD